MLTGKKILFNLSVAFNDHLSKIVTVLLITCIVQGTHAQVDTLRVGDRLNTTALMPKSFYLITSEKNDRATPLAITSRTVSFNENGDHILLTQETSVSDTAKSDIRIAEASKQNLVPFKNIVRTEAIALQTEFSIDSIFLRLDSLQKGTTRHASFHPKVNGFNFEMDYEIFGGISWKENYKVAIPFYQPGTRADAKYYVYEVVGSEPLIANGYAPVDCWKIKSDSYLSGKCTWWISKKERKVLKEERVRADGVKTLRTLISV